MNSSTKLILFMRNKMYAFVLIIPALVFSSCNNDKDEIGTATLKVRLTDAPGDYEAVFVDIQGVEIHASETPDITKGWVALKGIRPGIYDLLTLTNGIDTLIASDIIPAGKLSQIRLILGDKNSVKIGGKILPLKTPSAMQSGLKLQVNTTLQDGIVYTLLLDFDAARSIVKSGGSENYNLKPVIRTILEARSGAIKGLISPAQNAAVFAIAGTDTIGTFTDKNGYFLVKGLEAGTYQVIFQPGNQHTEEIIENVAVTTGVVTNVGTVAIE
jgi:hypothetical protein